jgi:hypothetical protein
MSSADFAPLAAVDLAAAISTAAPDEAAAQVKDVDRVFRLLRNAALLVVCALVLMVLFAYRKIWGGALYDKTLGKFRLPGIRDVPVFGPVLGPCFGYPYTHGAFRTRLAIRYAEGLRSGQDVITKILGSSQNLHVRVKCGLNPAKTTSVSSPNTDGVVTWNEPVDLDISCSDDYIFFDICESSGKAVASGQLDITDIWTDGTYAELRDPGVAHRSELGVGLENDRGKASGQLVMDALVIREGEKFLRAAAPIAPPDYEPLPSAGEKLQGML